MKPLSLYLHIPFCQKKCQYCDFPSYAGKEAFFTPYAKAMQQELLKKAPLAAGYEIQTIFIGGGTPTLLPVASFSMLLETLYSAYGISPHAEITVEANPGTLTKEFLSHALSFGINRVSMGVQSFSDPLLQRLGRIHTAAEALASYYALRNSGIKNINLDLMFSLPGQTLAVFLESLEKAVTLSPEHLSVYSLIVEENTPFYKQWEDGLLSLPEETLDRKQYHKAVAFLQEKGYQQYEISNFSKPQKECRHNLVYWQDEGYLGFGLCAHSYFDGMRFHNSTDLSAYCRQENLTKREDVEILPLAIQQAEFLFMGLRLTKGISDKRFQKRFSCSLFSVYQKELAFLLQQGLLAQEGDRIFLTPYGIDISNIVFEKFLPEEPF